MFYGQSGNPRPVGSNPGGGGWGVGGRVCWSEPMYQFGRHHRSAAFPLHLDFLVAFVCYLVVAQRAEEIFLLDLGQRGGGCHAIVRSAFLDERPHHLVADDGALLGV